MLIRISRPFSVGMPGWPIGVCPVSDPIRVVRQDGVLCLEHPDRCLTMAAKIFLERCEHGDIVIADSAHFGL